MKAILNHRATLLLTGKVLGGGHPSPSEKGHHRPAPAGRRKRERPNNSVTASSSSVSHTCRIECFVPSSIERFVASSRSTPTRAMLRLQAMRIIEIRRSKKFKGAWVAFEA